jgi:hypothetical protein
LAKNTYTDFTGEHACFITKLNWYLSSWLEPHPPHPPKKTAAPL